MRPNSTQGIRETFYTLALEKEILYTVKGKVDTFFIYFLIQL